jgi:glycosyltransferase involved in cell wall biosynthesis
MPMISIVTPCYNEEANVEALSEQVREIFESQAEYTYEHIFIDNASKDGTVAILKRLAEKDRRIKIIVNVRNFGHIKSPHHAILQAKGDAVVLLFADLQDPPQLIVEFLSKWKSGSKVVMAVKNQSEESPLMFMVRKAYYTLINRLSEVELVKNYTGFGLYDREVIEHIRKMDDPYPYFRGMVSYLGYPSEKIFYTQRARKRGITKNNFYTLYDLAMTGITNHSKVPLRLATMLGFASSVLSIITMFIYLIAKLIFWSQFVLGMAPILIGVFFFGSIHLFFLGIIGEYIGSIYTQILNRPLVIERERINF